MSKIPPALEADEWTHGYESNDLSVRLRNSMATDGFRLDVTVRAHPLGGALGDPCDIHALAALALHGQPFGFTWEDVDLLRDCVGRCADQLLNGERGGLYNLADRIEALLPPRRREP